MSEIKHLLNIGSVKEDTWEVGEYFRNCETGDVLVYLCKDNEGQRMFLKVDVVDRETGDVISDALRQQVTFTDRVGVKYTCVVSGVEDSKLETAAIVMNKIQLLEMLREYDVEKVFEYVGVDLDRLKIQIIFSCGASNIPEVVRYARIKSDSLL